MNMTAVSRGNRGMFDQQATQIDEFPYSPAAPMQHYGRAIMAGTGSRTWNRFLASLPPKDRADAVKSARSAQVYNHPSCYWPREKSFKRGSAHGS